MPRIRKRFVQLPNANADQLSTDDVDGWLVCYAKVLFGASNYDVGQSWVEVLACDLLFGDWFQIENLQRKRLADDRFPKLSAALAIVWMFVS